MRSIPSIESLKSHIDQAVGARDKLQSRLVTVKADIIKQEKDESLLALVAELFRGFIDREVNIGMRAVESLQTEGLRAVFDDQDLRVRADVETQRGKVSVDLVTIQSQQGDDIEGSGYDAFGGAVATVQSVLLRIIAIIRRGMVPVLFMDETLPAFDSNYVTNMGKFLLSLCTNLKVKVLLVTHNPMLEEAAQRKYRVVKLKGSAKVLSHAK